MVRKLSMIATERVKSGEWLPPWTVAEHEARYAFASRFVRGLAVVDCASGNGNGAAVFLRSEPASLVGFDVDQEAVDAANTALGTDLASFRRAEATALPAGDATADVFISLETVEHVEDDRGLLGEVARVLKPDGLFICSTPNRSVTNPGTGLTDRPWNPFHVREYTPLEYLDLLTERFEVVGWYGQNRTAGAKVRWLEWIAGIFGPKVAVRINQAWKCRWFLVAGGAVHRVTESAPDHHDEYMVAVCRPKAKQPDR